MCDRFEYSSVILGHHIYTKIFLHPKLKRHPRAEREPDNDCDSFAVASIEIDTIVNIICLEPFQYRAICF